MSDAQKPTEVRTIEGKEIVAVLYKKFVEAEIATLKELNIPYSAVVASLIESTHTSFSTKCAILSGMTRETFLQKAGEAYDLNYKSAEARGITQGMELSRAAVEEAQKVFNDAQTKH